MKNLQRYFEAVVWITALLFLAFMNPAAEDQLSFCFFKWMGFTFCPGCGLGHSISWLFRGEITKSLEEHPLGIFAVLILLHRIYIGIFKNKSLLTA